MERAVNGSLGESVTGYSYGVWRESYSVETGMGTAAGAGVGMWNGSGTYYYTGTGSVANIVAGNGTKGYSYGPGGSVTVYGQGSLEGRTNTQAACYGYNGEYTHGSLGLQYLRARYLKVETGTFTSRDTYAGRVRDILSQNRYTYAENNPVTFADPSGHKITFGTMMGNMFGGGRNTGRNGGIGALMGNTAKTIADKVASTTRAAQNTTRSAVNLATGNPAAAAKNQLDNVVAQATGGITGTLGGGSPSVNGPGGIAGFVESVAAQIEAVRCQAYEYSKNKEQEKIKDVCLASGAAYFDDMIGRIKTGNVGFKETTLEFIIRYEGDPFLIPRINADGTFTAGYGYDFSEETDPEMFRRYFKRDANGKLQVIRTMTLQEARDLVKIAADKKGIIQGLNNFINGTGNGNVGTPLSINQNQYDALFSYFYSNGGNVFADENNNAAIAKGGEIADRAKARVELRDYLINNNGNYDEQTIHNLFVNSKGGNLKYTYEERRTEEANLFNKND